MSQNRELNRIASLLESLIDANDASDRVAFDTRRETLADVRQIRLQLDRIEANIGGAEHAPPAHPTALQQLAAGTVPVAWFSKGAVWFAKRILPHLVAAAGGGWLAHALHLFG